MKPLLTVLAATALLIGEGLLVSVERLAEALGVRVRLL